MKKFVLPILCLLLLATSCRKDEVVIYRDSYYGSYVYTDYQQINKNQLLSYPNQFETEYIYYEYEDKNIDKEMIRKGFALVYFVDADGRDNQLPMLHSFIGTDGLEHRYIIRYDISKQENSPYGYVAFIVESLDGNYAETFRNLPDYMSFKVCIVKNN